MVYHRLAEFYRDELSYGVVEADNILRRLGIFGLQGDHHILVKFLQLHRNAVAVLNFIITTRMRQPSDMVIILKLECSVRMFKAIISHQITA